MPPSENGLMMNMCAVAGFASSGTRARRAFDLLERADQTERAAGDRRAARIGVELARTRNRRLNQHRGDRRQDDRRQDARSDCRRRDRRGGRRRRTSRSAPIIMIAAASVAATELIRMSRCFTCASSCAITPSSSSSLRICRMPSVAATAACCGLRPVAKALGDACGMTYTFGIGRPARCGKTGDDAVQPMFGPDLRRAGTSPARSCRRTSTRRSW